MEIRSNGARDFMSEWRLDPTARDDELRVANVQYNSVVRVAKMREVRAARIAESCRRGESSDGEVVEDLGGGGFSDEEENAILRQRMISSSAHSRPLSASAARPLPGQGDGVPKPTCVRRPQSASGSRRTREVLSPTQKHSHDFAWMPAKIKESKWTEMLQLGPQFQEQSLKRLEAETYALLREVLGRPSCSRQNKIDREVFRTDISKRKETERNSSSVEYGRAKRGVAVGSGLQVARTNQKPSDRRVKRCETGKHNNPEVAQRRSVVEKTKARTKSTARLARSRPRGEISDKQRQKRQEEAQARAKVMQEMGWLEDVGLRKAPRAKIAKAKKSKVEATNKTSFDSQAVEPTERTVDDVVLEQELTILQSLTWREGETLHTARTSGLESGSKTEDANVGGILDDVDLDDVQGSIFATGQITVDRIYQSTSSEGADAPTVGARGQHPSYPVHLADNDHDEDLTQLVTHIVHSVPTTAQFSVDEPGGEDSGEEIAHAVQVSTCGDLVHTSDRKETTATTSAVQKIQRQYRVFTSRPVIREHKTLRRSQRSWGDDGDVHYGKAACNGHTTADKIEPPQESLEEVLRGDSDTLGEATKADAGPIMGELLYPGTDSAVRMNQKKDELTHCTRDEAQKGQSGCSSTLEKTACGMLEHTRPVQDSLQICNACDLDSRKADAELVDSYPCTEVDNSLWRRDVWRRGDRAVDGFPRRSSTRETGRSHQHEAAVYVEDASPTVGGSELPQADHGSRDGCDERIGLLSPGSCVITAQCQVSEGASDGPSYPSPCREAVVAAVDFDGNDVVERSGKERVRVTSGSVPHEVGDSITRSWRPTRDTTDDSTSLRCQSAVQEDIQLEVCVGRNQAPEASPVISVGPSPRVGEEGCLVRLPLLEVAGGHKVHDGVEIRVDVGDNHEGTIVGDDRERSVDTGDTTLREALSDAKKAEAANRIRLCWIHYGWRAKRVRYSSAGAVEAVCPLTLLETPGQVQPDPRSDRGNGNVFALQSEGGARDDGLNDTSSCESSSSVDERDVSGVDSHGIYAASTQRETVVSPPDTPTGVATDVDSGARSSRSDQAALSKPSVADGVCSTTCGAAQQACAARRIQRQYRTHVSRRNLLDQLAFLVRRHRRESRKKTRRLSQASQPAAITDHPTQAISSNISHDLNDGSAPVCMESAPAPDGVAPTDDESLFVARDLHEEVRQVKREASCLLLVEHAGGRLYSPLSADAVCASAEGTAHDDGQLEAAAVVVEETEADDGVIGSDGAEPIGEIKTMWERYMDEHAKKSFYYNPTRRVSQWDRPTNDEVIDMTAEPPSCVDSHHLDAEAPAYSDTLLEEAKVHGEQWERYVDSATNKSFYFNAARRVSQWTRPNDGTVVDTTVSKDDEHEAASETPLAVWQQTKEQATLLESHGGWDRYLAKDGAEVFYHHVERGVFVHETELPSRQFPGEFTDAKERLLTPTSDDSGDRWTLRRNRSLKGEKRGAWQAFVDTETHQTFYYNTHTGESSWEKPGSYDSTAAQCQVASFLWVMYVDEASTQPYYVNVLTNATSWSKPEDFDSAVTTEPVDRLARIREPCDSEDGEQDEYVISIHDEQDAAAWLTS